MAASVAHASDLDGDGSSSVVALSEHLTDTSELPKSGWRELCKISRCPAVSPNVAHVTFVLVPLRSLAPWIARQDLNASALQ